MRQLPAIDADVPTGKLTFARDTGFHDEVKRRVLAYFERTGLSQQDSPRMHLKTGAAALLPAPSPPSPWCSSEIVRATCAEFGVRYNAHESFFGALASHWRWLRRMGQPLATAT
jgi:hypothetical protein